MTHPATRRTLASTGSGECRCWQSIDLRDDTLVEVDLCPDGQVRVYCGTGVTASLSGTEATIARLYDTLGYALAELKRHASPAEPCR